MNTPSSLSRDLTAMQLVAIDAMGVMPTRSKYRRWASQLIAEELPAYRYPKLRERLLQYVSKNNLSERFNIWL